MTILSTIASYAAIIHELVDYNNDNFKQQAIDKYWDACKYPRKQKKRIRKEAQLEYNLACYNPLDNL